MAPEAATPTFPPAARVGGEGRAAHRAARTVLSAVVDARLRGPVDPRDAHAARRVLLDTLACAVAGRQAPEVRAFEAQAARLDPGVAALPGGPGLSVTAFASAFAMAATWDEACEGHAFAHGRPGVPLAAALLPLSLALDSDRAALERAFVLGYEVGARAGGWLRIRPGMHVDGCWPALGVAAGCAALLGLDAAGVDRAIDIAGCQLATSLYRPVATGHTARNTYLGHSAMLGLQAAQAAAAGIGAPDDALVEQALQLGSASADPLPVADRSLIRGGYLKPFAAVRHVHYGAQAAARVRETLPRDAAGAVDTRGIASIVLSVYEEATIYCGNRAPRTPIQAQFSLSFGLAAMLRIGRLDPDAYSPAHFDDAELRRLESRVELRVDPAYPPGRRGADLRVEGSGRDGRPFSCEARVAAVPGDPDHPLDDDALAAKCRRYLGAWPAATVEALVRRWLAAGAEAGADTRVSALWPLADAAARPFPHPST